MNDVLTWVAHKLIIRLRVLLPSLLSLFKHLMHLNLAQCFDQLQDTDLEMPFDFLKKTSYIIIMEP